MAKKKRSGWGSIFDMVTLEERDVPRDKETGEFTSEDADDTKPSGVARDAFTGRFKKRPSLPEFELSGDK